MINSILIVDDNKPNRELLKIVLKDLIPNIMEAVDGQACLSLAEKMMPDIILMDIQLPVMDGTEALKKLQENPVTAHIPVIAFTSYAMKDDKEKLLAMGFKGYIAKPINIDEFYAVLAQFK